MTQVDSTMIQVGLSISTKTETYEQAGEFVIGYDLRSEISSLVRYLLPLIFVYLTVGLCFLDDGVKALVEYGRGWWFWLKLSFYAVMNNEGAYYGLART